MGINGEGIGRYNDYAFFVKDAIIGDEVRAVITKLNKGYGFAKAISIEKASEYRCEPACPNAGRCGGCQIMQMEYSRQLKFKADKVKNNLERLGGQKGFTFRPIIGMDEAVPEHFRNKVQFPVGLDKDGNVVTGFYAGRTHYIVPTEECCVSSPEADRVLRIIRDFIKENKISVYNEVTGEGLVRHVLIRTGTMTGQLMVCLVINGDGLKGRLEQKFVSAIRNEFPDADSICLNINKKNTNVILGDKVRVLSGRDYIEDKIGDLRFRISPLSFFQVNSIQTEKLYSKALEYAGLSGNETVWDLYCGAGTISLFLAQKAKKVYGVEIVAPSIENAKVNAAANGISNVEFFCGASEEVFPEKVRSGKAGADVVVVDPPRKGCDPWLLEAILQVGPERIVYVSCDSATLARDIKLLTADGRYRLIEATPVDMFPHTVHVETVVLLSGEKVDGHIDIDLDVEKLKMARKDKF